MPLGKFTNENDVEDDGRCTQRVSRPQINLEAPARLFVTWLFQNGKKSAGIEDSLVVPLSQSNLSRDSKYP